MQTAVFEARYERGWRLWDRSGELWTAMQRKYREIRLITGQPTLTVFRLGPDYELTVELEKTSTKSHNPGASLERFQVVASDLLDTASEALQLLEYTRLGLRFVFVKQYSSIDDASAALLALNLMKIPDGLRFGIKGGVPKFPEYSIRWENEDLGATLRFKADSLPSLKIDFPFDWDGPTMDGSALTDRGSSVSLDVDLFTKSFVTSGQLKTDEWIATGYRNIRRELEHILKG